MPRLPRLSVSAVRKGRDNQTIEIPTRPDTSRILSVTDWPGSADPAAPFVITNLAVQQLPPPRNCDLLPFVEGVAGEIRAFLHSPFGGSQAAKRSVNCLTLVGADQPYHIPDATEAVMGCTKWTRYCCFG